jgi:HPt (histidine-containing phosphotransfer) domain-containing protein
VPPWPIVKSDAAVDDVLDVEVLAELRTLEEPGEASLLTELVEAFRGSAPGHVARLKSALAGGDAAAFGDAAHALKGGAATLGATRLRNVAYDLEQRGRDGNLVDVDAAVSALETAFHAALAALSREALRARQEVAA